MSNETLNNRELAYAMALRDVRPDGTVTYQAMAWRELRDLIRMDCIRPTRWERFIEVTERGP